MSRTLWACIRVSGDQQADRGRAVAGQRPAIEEYAREHNLHLVRVFVDEARSGAEFKAAMWTRKDATMILERICSMLQASATDSPVFPPTVFYNEGWLLRLVLDWYSRHRAPKHPLSFRDNARWFSEAWLPSAFLARHRGDQLAESWTHADAAIGHFRIGNGGKANLSLLADATSLVVIEAKMFSRLSQGVTHAKYFDQAARTVACIAEILGRADRSPERVTDLGFRVLAPQLQIARGAFKEMDRGSIQAKVERRVKEYGGAKDKWFSDWCRPTLGRIDIRIMSWEELLATIRRHDAPAGNALDGFYKKCVEFNLRPARRKG